MSIEQEISNPRPSLGIIDLGLLVQQLLKYSWLIILFALLFGVLAFFFAVRPAPYETHATVSIEPTGASAPIISINDIDIEMGRIRSWTTVQKVVSAMPFHGIITKKWIPGERNKKEQIKEFLKTGKKHEELMGMPMQVEAMSFPTEYHGKILTLEVLPANRFSLKDHKGQELLNAEVGNIRNSKTSTFLFYVSRINAPTGSLFHVIPLSEETMVERILTNFKVTKRTTNRTSSLLDFSFFWPDPHFSLRFMQEIVQGYIDNSMLRLTRSKQSALDELTNELNKHREKLRKNEEELSSYMRGLDVADVNAEMRGQLELKLTIEQSLRDLHLQKAQLRQIYTHSHPAMKAVYEKEAKLNSRLKLINDRLSELPEIKGMLFTLNRTVDQQSREYELLLEQIAELRLESSTITNPANLINEPRIVRRNLLNKTIQVIILGCLMGAIIAFCLIVLRVNLRVNTLEKPEQLGYYPALSMNDGRGKKLDDAIDEVVSQLSYLTTRKKGNLAILTAPDKTKEGAKLTLKLAEAYAEREGKILVIDGNLKTSALAEEATYNDHEGLANIMAGNALDEDLIKRLGHSNLFYMPPGKPPMSLMILHDFERLDYILKELGKIFSCIIIDLPSRHELPFWEKLLAKSSLVIHLMQLDSPLPSIKDYLHHTNQLATNESHTLHEALLFSPKGVKK